MGEKQEEMDWAEILQAWSKTICRKGHYKSHKRRKEARESVPSVSAAMCFAPGPGDQSIVDWANCMLQPGCLWHLPRCHLARGHREGLCSFHCVRIRAHMWGQVSHLAVGKQIPGKQRIRCPASGEQLSLILSPLLSLSLTWSQRNPARLWTLYSSCYPCSKWWATAVACKSLLRLDFTLIIVSIPLQWVLVPTELKTLAGQRMHPFCLTN